MERVVGSSVVDRWSSIVGRRSLVVGRRAALLSGRSFRLLADDRRTPTVPEFYPMPVTGSVVKW
jgi:hypothetical protein